jgi:hypothetical protein
LGRKLLSFARAFVTKDPAVHRPLEYVRKGWGSRGSLVQAKPRSGRAKSIQMIEQSSLEGSGTSSHAANAAEAANAVVTEISHVL